MVGIIIGSTYCSSFAQISTAALNRENNLNYGLGFGISTGVPIGKDAYFVGASLDFIKPLGSKLGMSSSLAFDSERAKETMQPDDKIVNTFTLIVAVSYLVLPKLSIATGFGQGFIDDDNINKRMQFSLADLGTGVAFGYLFGKKDSNSNKAVSLSLTFEYNLTTSDVSISTDLAIGFGFVRKKSK